MVNQKYLDKAEVLIEALPYIQRFNRKVIVVKYGGSAMVDEQLKRDVIKDVVLLKLVGFKPIIVHGGGKEISRWVGKVGKEAKFVNGLRVTDDETMEIAEMVLGKVNMKSCQNVGPLRGPPVFSGSLHQIICRLPCRRAVGGCFLSFTGYNVCRYGTIYSLCTRRSTGSQSNRRCQYRSCQFYESVIIPVFHGNPLS